MKKQEITQAVREADGVSFDDLVGTADAADIRNITGLI